MPRRRHPVAQRIGLHSPLGRYGFMACTVGAAYADMPRTFIACLIVTLYAWMAR